MALTNVIQEPRREFTEQGLGLAIWLIVGGVCYFPGEALARWTCYLADNYSRSTYWSSLVVGMIAVFFAGWMVLNLMHNTGEALANNLAKRGIEIRGPRRQGVR